MKKLIVLTSLFFLSLGAFAYGTNYIQDLKTYQEKETKQKDCVMMKNGNMVVYKDGQSTDMLKAVVMSNGTKVLANGEIILKNGDISKMQNGDVVYMNGKIEKKPE